MTKNTRDYLNRYLDVLQVEHKKQLTAGVVNSIISALALSGMLVSMGLNYSFLAALCGFLFGYYSALFNGIRVKLCLVKDELANVREQLANG